MFKLSDGERYYIGMNGYIYQAVQLGGHLSPCWRPIASLYDRESYTPQEVHLITLTLHRQLIELHSLLDDAHLDKVAEAAHDSRLMLSVIVAATTTAPPDPEEAPDATED